MIEQKKIAPKWRLVGVFASDADFLTDFNKTSLVKPPQIFIDSSMMAIKIYDGETISIYRPPAIKTAKKKATTKKK